VIDQLTVRDDYGKDDLRARVNQALQQAGLGAGPVDWSDLAPLDQFHVRGLAATKELAADLRVEVGASVFDVGCGLGGPARFLAATYGCRVTEIDLSQHFVDIATMLTERAGLMGSVRYRQADALDLPFSDATFDHAWTQHVAMNIADRGRLYGRISRVLKPGGRLAIYDVVAGDGRPLVFPVPWAREPEISFLLAPDEMRTALSRGGFVEVSWADKTDTAIRWFAEQQAARRSATGSPPLGIHVVMGADFAGMAENFGRNLREGRARLVQAVVRRG
jgi:SAM-dependent methyltransferase